jgi:hypothetical protein
MPQVVFSKNSPEGMNFNLPFVLEVNNTITIPQLPPASTLTGTEQLMIQQGTTTCFITLNQLATFILNT